MSEMIQGGTVRGTIHPGLEVDIVLKRDQRTGALTRGVVKEILTKSPSHPHGIKVRLMDGQVGRVKAILGGGASASAGTGAANTEADG